MIHYPTSIHEAPLEDISVLLHEFVRLPYPRQFLRVSIPPNFPLTSSDLNATPDMTLCLQSLRGRRELRLPILVECAFTQGIDRALDQTRREVESHPEIRMVILIDITEAPAYSSPARDSPAWDKFKDLPALQLDDFLTTCDPQLQDVPEFLKPVTSGGHKWAHISTLKYHVWVRESEGDGTLEDWPQLDLEANESEYVAHGVSSIICYEVGWLLI